VPEELEIMKTFRKFWSG